MEEKNKNTIRILHISDCLYLGGGVSSVILNWHKNIDRSKVQFDYLYFKDSYPTIDGEIKKLGGNIYKLPYPSFKKPWIFIKAVRDFFKTHQYSIIHSHIESFSFIFFPIAKFYGVKNIVQHTHNPRLGEKFLENLRNRFLFFLSKPFITKKIACSDSSGKKNFGNNYTIINNGIDTTIFKFNSNVRNEIRKELNIENRFVIGNIGRFAIQKNLSFLVNVFSEIHKQNKNSVLLLVGDGPLKNEIKKQVYNLNLTKYVVFLEVRKDIEKIYQAMDCFVFPSLFEGMGIVAIEAQSCGLPCFLSNGVPQETMICNTTKILLSKSAKEWANIIVDKIKNFERKDCSKFVEKAGFDIKYTAKKIEDFYLKL